MSAIAHRLPPETAVLGMLEGVLSFAAIALVILLAHTNFPVATPATVTRSIALALCLSVLLGGFALVAGLYQPSGARRPVRLVSAGSAALLGFGSALFFLCAEMTSPAGGELVLAAQLLAGWGSAVMTARILHGLALRHRPLARRVLLVGDAAATDAFLDRLGGLPGYQFETVSPGGQDSFCAATARRRVWGVVIAPAPGQPAGAALPDIRMRGRRVLTASAFQEKCLGRVDIDTLTMGELMTSRGFATSAAATVLKRASDLAFGLGLLLATLPVMILTIIAIKIDSAGPVFYTQRRIGQFGNPFTVLKFRSMAVDAEAGGTPQWAQQHDPRVTRVGRFIRASRIDELPQLLNVIRGDMSLVGPRPERPHFVEELARAIPFYRERSWVKPGLTGWAQVNYPYGASVEDAREKLAYDLYYIKNRSFLLDLVILCATVRVVLNGEGAR